MRAQRPRALARIVTARRRRTPSPWRARSTREKAISAEEPPSFAMPIFLPATGRHGNEGLVWDAPPSQAAEGLVQRAATDHGRMVPHPAVLPEVIDVLIFPYTPS